MKYLICVFLSLMLIGINVKAQELVQAFYRNDSVAVYHADDSPLKFAWTGGLNNPQFSSFDLNNDALNDYVIFDKANNHIITFLNNGEEGDNWQFAPEYANLFPAELHDWMLLLDYNNDGINDIFTYTTGGAGLYQTNISGDGNYSFTLVEDVFSFEGFSGIINISMNSSDLPAFTDINNDGDIDVLVFEFSGKYVEYYENQSVELTGSISDTIFFAKNSDCWGYFSESFDNNTLTLDDPDCMGGLAYPFTESVVDEQRQIHSGSTMLAFDEDGNGLQDLLLGDVSYPNLVLVNNTGALNDAYMSIQDTIFPSYDTPGNVSIFPAPFLIDVDNDNLADLLIASNETFRSTDLGKVWYYKNIGTESNYVFEYQSSNFLNNEMIDVGTRSYPCLIDANQDDLIDIVVGSYGRYDTTLSNNVGRLSVYENTGTADNPSFSLLTNDLSNLSNYEFLGIYPSFADLDNDGDADMIAGDEQGLLHYHQNTAAPGQLMTLELTQAAIIDLPGSAKAAVPFLYDVNKDALVDLIIGSWTGILFYYQNVGTPEVPNFELQNDFWGGVSVGGGFSPLGYAAPCIAKLDTTDKEYLLVNSDSGKVWVYTDLDQPTFTFIDTLLSQVNEGGRGGITTADINNNAGIDIVLGNYRGGLALFSQVGIPTDTGATVPPPNVNDACTIWPNPLDPQQELINIALATNQQIQEVVLYNVQGQARILNCPVNTNSYQCKLPNFLTDGMYLLKIKTNKHVFSKKLLLNGN